MALITWGHCSSEHPKPRRDCAIRDCAIRVICVFVELWHNIGVMKFLLSLIAGLLISINFHVIGIYMMIKNKPAPVKKKIPIPAAPKFYHGKLY